MPNPFSNPGSLSDTLRGFALGPRGVAHGAQQMHSASALFKALHPKTADKLLREFATAPISGGRDLTREGQGMLKLQQELQEALRGMELEQQGQQQGGRSRGNTSQAPKTYMRRQAEKVAERLFLTMLQGHFEPTQTAQKLLNAGLMEQFRRSLPVAPLRASPIPSGQGSM